ncbi:MAG: hypothetical protein AAF196_16865 [Planctomycetota bacterium]
MSNPLDPVYGSSLEPEAFRSVPGPMGLRLRAFEDGFEFEPHLDGLPMTRGRFFDRIGTGRRLRVQLDRWLHLACDGGRMPVLFECAPIVGVEDRRPMRFVVLRVPSLGSVAIDRASFRSQFEGREPARVRSFENLSRDAVLVVPSPFQSGDLRHLATFLEEADPVLRDQFWQLGALEAASLLQDSGRPTPLFVSTSGFGVGWLHLRLSTVPKYYRHRAYSTPGGG